MTFCPYCGEELTSKDTECPRCHGPLMITAPTVYKCFSCGKEISDEYRFCPHCGANQSKKNKEPPKTREGSAVVKEKDEVVAIILSVIFTGFGTLYAGSVTRGITLMFAQVLMLVITFFVFYTFPICFVLWIYGIYDGYKETHRINEMLREYNS